MSRVAGSTASCVDTRQMEGRRGANGEEGTGEKEGESTAACSTDKEMGLLPKEPRAERN